MKRHLSVVIVLLLAWINVPLWAQTFSNDQPFIYAVVTKVPKDRHVVTAQVLFEGAVVESKLMPVESIVSNTVWRNLEICHSMKATVKRVPDGYQLLSVRVVDASMLPMGLQSIAGDCLIKKAIEVAPLVD